MSKIQHNMALVVEEHNKQLRKSHEEYYKYLDNLEDEIKKFKKHFGESLYDICKENGVFEHFDNLEILDKDLIQKYIAQEKQCLEIVGIDYFFNRLHKEFPGLSISRDDFLMLCFAMTQLEIIKDIFGCLRRTLNNKLEDIQKELMEKKMQENEN